MPDALDVDAVVAALRDDWDFDVDVADYAAVGGGSYHWQVTGTAGARGFVTVDDLDQKAWLGDGRDVVFDGLHRAFDTAVALRDGGLSFVVAPVATPDGESLRRIDERYVIALFPLVEGESAEFGHFEGEDEARLDVVALLAELHAASALAEGLPGTSGLDLPGRRHLEAALEERNEPWSGGPLSEVARNAVKSSAAELVELLGLADRLAAEAKAHGGRFVVTHGEPHAGNVMRTREGRVLVDWDTVALAPPERDLWMLVGAGTAAADLYARATGRTLDPIALDYFRLTWDLKDLAEYLKLLRSPHQENDDTRRACQALVNCAAIREEWATSEAARRSRALRRA
jgi:spectinomycin phosphotransferase